MDNAKLILELQLQNNQYLQQLVKAQGSTQTAAKSMQSSFTAIKGAVSAVIFSTVTQQIVDLVQEAGRLDSVTRAYTSAITLTGKSADGLIKDLQGVTRGTLSVEAAMEGSTLAVNLLGKEVTDKLPEMARIAKAAARTTGASVDQMFRDIITASGRQSVQILDNLGISSAKASQYMDEYAASLGKSRNQLTSAEKSAAFFHATLKAGNEIIKNAGDEALTLGERLQVATNTWKDLKAEFLKGATEGIDQSISSLTTKTEGATSAATILGKTFGGILEHISAKISSVVRVFDTSSWGKREYWINLGLIAADGIIYGAGNVIRKAFGLGKEFGNEFSKGINATRDNLGLDLASKAIDTVRKQAEARRPTPSGGGGSGMSAAQEMSNAIEAAADYNAKMIEEAKQKTQNAVKDITSTMFSGATTMLSGVGSLFDQMADRAIQSFDRITEGLHLALDMQYQKQLETAGLQEESRGEILQKEIDDLQQQYEKTRSLTKKKSLQETIALKQKEKKKAEIEEAYQKKQQALDLLMDTYRMQMQRRQFERNKQYQIAMVWVNTAAAITAAWLAAWSLGFPPLALAMGIISTALLLANAGVQTAVISRQQAPAFAQGAWDLPADTPAQLHKNEMVMPAPYAQDFRQAVEGGGGAEEIHVHLELDGNEIHQAVVRRENKMAKLLGAKSRFSYAGAYG